MVSVMFGMASVLLLPARRKFIGVDPPRPASPRLRSPLDFFASTRRARLRRACDRR
jgi:hypothetical protein